MKKIKLEYIITLVLVTLMVLCSDIFHEKEFIFPEITALTIGAWLAPKQPWKVSKLKIFLLITLHSIIGLCLVLYFPYSLIIKIITGLIICLISLSLFKTSFAPLISATILPIVINTTSWIYPISASIMTFIIVVIQLILEKKSYRLKNKNLIAHYDLSKEMIINIERLVFVFVIASLAIKFNAILMIAPPLIVGFVELTSINTSLRSKSKSLILIIILSALNGALSRYILTEMLHLPLTISTIVACIMMLLIVDRSEIYFPPAGAITILPMLISSQAVITYPLYVTIGFTLMVLYSHLLAKQSFYPQNKS